WCFLINVPVGLLALIVAGIALREHREATAGRLDVPGFFLGSLGLASLVDGLAEAGSRGWTDGVVLTTASAGLAALAAFVLVELRAERPMIDIRLFRYRLFAAGSAVLFLSTAGFSGAVFLLPLLLQAERGLGALDSGLTMFPAAVGAMMMAPVAGRLYVRYGPRRLLLAGMISAAITTLAHAWVGLQTSEWTIRALMLTRGWAFALGTVPLQTATFAEVRPAELGSASASFSVVGQVAASFGVSILATALTSRLTAHGAALGDPATNAAAIAAFHDAFLVGTLVHVLAIATTFLVDDKLAASTMRRAPAPAEEAVEDDEERAAA
ncbi:MAG: MFS transporter, partial [Thermomicrobiaceae bacterium]|nr:MFS transporter [Thermomicrobiaceae bacterium]